MIRSVAAAAALILTISPWVAQAAEQSVVLHVRNANCVLCAPIVQRALARVPGVAKVEVEQADRMADPVATVTFDDAKTDVEALIAATTNAGYPSEVANLAAQ